MQKSLNIEAVKDAMTSLGLNQTAISNEVGVSREAVSNWITDKKLPRPATLLKLGKLLKLSIYDLVIKNDPYAPVVAYRKAKGTITKNHHIEKAQEMGRALRSLVPYLPFDKLEMPPVLKSPSCDYEYLQEVAIKTRKDINLTQDDTVDFDHLIRRFKDLHAVVIPTIWGAKQAHGNAIHVYLPDSQTTWVYLNLDVNVHDFKFWMAHELGHCLSPNLRDEDAEDFADAFASALLFPQNKAEKAYKAISCLPTKTKQINELLAISDLEIISPYTVLIQIEEYIKTYTMAPLLIDRKKLGGIVTNFNKKYKNVSDCIFEKLSSTTPKNYISQIESDFKTPFFEILGQFLRAENASPGYVEAVTDMRLFDARGIHSELT